MGPLKNLGKLRTAFGLFIPFTGSCQLLNHRILYTFFFTMKGIRHIIGKLPGSLLLTTFLFNGFDGDEDGIKEIRGERGSPYRRRSQGAAGEGAPDRE
jgi:hypothetical protein